MAVDVVLAGLIMPLTMIIAAQGWLWTIFIFVIFPATLLLLYFQAQRSRTRSRFFFSWSVTSFIFLLGVFQFEVVPFLEILFIENFILMCFVSAMCLCAYLTKTNATSVLSAIPSCSGAGLIKVVELQWPNCELCNLIQPPRSNHCKLCGCCVPRRDHHSVWFDVCIGIRNHRFYFCALLFLFISCCYSANLTLTTICHPTLIGSLLLIPEDCSDVYGDIHIGLCFVSAVYTVMIAALSLCLLLQQIWLVCHNTTFQECKQGQSGLYSKGMYRNCIEFWLGFP